VKSAAFEYIRPTSLAEAVDCIADLTAAGKDVQALAGGQSLLAMMNLRVSAPEVLIDISRIEQLKIVQEGPNAVRLGACVTHAAIEDGRVPDPSRGLMRKVAENIAYRAIRTRGTIGGSLALSDPAGDWVTVMQALGAQVALVGPTGRREVDALEFTTGIYETVREKDELIESLANSRIRSRPRFSIRRGAWHALCSGAPVQPLRCSTRRRRAYPPA
jgi:carbon-monoxide dehydrogenase medium subunit